MYDGFGSAARQDVHARSARAHQSLTAASNPIHAMSNPIHAMRAGMFLSAIASTIASTPCADRLPHVARQSADRRFRPGPSAGNPFTRVLPAPNG